MRYLWLTEDRVVLHYEKSDMPRINSAKYKDEIIDAFEVDDDYETFILDAFKCPECLVQLENPRSLNVVRAVLRVCL